ncbi:MAG TPA: XRE family transcriptional regulator [Bacillota bacterium]|nr:XRE family transcriptional regulator [Bacillota bacterium]
MAARSKRTSPASEVGTTVRAHRLACGYTLKELAARTGFSPSFLSQLERGRCSVSITSLHRIAQELGVGAAVFFPQVRANSAVTRASQRPLMAVEGSRLSYERLSGEFPRRTADLFLVTMQPGEIQDGPYRHQGEEFGMILEGTMHFHLGEDEFDLGPGDTIHFHSTTAHLWCNQTETTVRALWMTTQRLS